MQDRSAGWLLQDQSAGWLLQDQCAGWLLQDQSAGWLMQDQSAGCQILSTIRSLPQQLRPLSCISQTHTKHYQLVA